jgi:hypothetical protein
MFTFGSAGATAGAATFLTGAAVAVAVGRAGWGGRAWLATGTGLTVTTEETIHIQYTSHTRWTQRTANQHLLVGSAL